MFFLKRGLKRNSKCFYDAPLPLAQRPLKIFHANVRRRARIRRELREEFGQSAYHIIVKGRLHKGVAGTMQVPPHADSGLHCS